MMEDRNGLSDYILGRSPDEAKTNVDAANYSSEGVTIDIQSNAHNNSTSSFLSDADYILAATYVQDARLGRHSYFMADEDTVRRYIFYQHSFFKAILFLCILLHLGLVLIEKPTLPAFEAPYWVPMILELLCLGFYTFRFVHMMLYMETVKFWSDKRNLVLLLLIFLVILDMLIFISLVQSGIYALRWSRVLRPVFFVCLPEGRLVRRAIRNIRRTLPDVINLVVLFYFFVALAALMAFKLFSTRNLTYPTGRKYFSTYSDSIFDMFVLVTTANNPDVMMPAYDADGYFSLFFVVFTTISVYVFMNVFLAVINNNYRKHLKDEVKKAVYTKRQQLAKAFDILKEHHNSRFVVTRERLFRMLIHCPPDRSPTLCSILWFALNSDGHNHIDKLEFLQIADILNVKVSEVRNEKPWIGRQFPRVYNCFVSKWIRKIVKHRAFRYFFDVVILVNAVFIAAGEDQAEWYFLGVFSMEIGLKIYTFGFTNFCRRYWNIFDLAVIGSAIVIGAYEEIRQSDTGSRLTLDFLLVLRCLRIVKIINNVKRFQVLITTIVNLLPALTTYGAVIAILYYMFAVVGMELYAGLVQESRNGTELPFCANDKLRNTAFWNDRYCKNNFNNILRSLLVLFDLTIVNQWHIIAGGFVAVTSKWSRLYFFLFHQLAVLIVLNIFTAFVLEVFILEYSLTRGNLENRVEMKIKEMGLNFGREYSKKVEEENVLVDEMEGGDIDADHDVVINEQHNPSSQLPDLSKETDIRFHCAKSLKNVEVVLHRMFENEIKMDDLGPEITHEEFILDEDIPNLMRRRLTLSHDA